MSENRNCFATTVADLGKCKTAEMTIQLNTDVPVNTKPYRIPFAKHQIVNDIIHELLEPDVIRPSNSQYVSRIVLVKKKNGEHRMCVDG